MASVGVAASLPLARSLSLPLHLPHCVSFSNHFDDVKSGFYSWPKRGKVLGLKSKRMLGRIVRGSCALFGVTCGEQQQRQQQQQFTRLSMEFSSLALATIATFDSADSVGTNNCSKLRAELAKRGQLNGGLAAPPLLLPSAKRNLQRQRECSVQHVAGEVESGAATELGNGAGDGRSTRR